MAEKSKKSEEQSETTTEEKKQKKLKGYENLIDRLKEERKELQEELDRDYREARRYVRSHPEESILIAFFGGVTLGYIFGKLGRK